MISKLREHTHELHQEIEKENLTSKIMDHSISLRLYKTLLLQNFIAYKVVEVEISRHIPQFSSDKAERLSRDLEDLKIDLEVWKDFKDKFSIDNQAEAIGAQYVLEGSVMGGMLISRELKECPALQSISEPQFFNGDRKSMDGWKQFMSSIKDKKFTAKEEKDAIKKAQDTFRFFGEVFTSVNTETAKV